MAKLKLVVKALDEIEEAFRPLYSKQTDGTYVLDAEDDAGPILGLRKNRDEAIERFKALQKKYEGIDPEKAREFADRIAKLDEDEAKKSNDWAARERQLIEKHDTALKAERAKTEKALGALRRNLIDNVAAAEMRDLGGRPKLLLPAVRDQLRMAETDDGYVVQVVDGKGNQRIGDTHGNAMTIRQLLTEMKEDSEWAHAFDGSGSSGSGSPTTKTGGDGKGGGTMTVKGSFADQNFMANVDKIAKGEVKVATG